MNKLAHAAGIFDAAGTITICSRKTRESHTRILKVILTATNDNKKSIIRYLKSEFGGSVFNHNTKYRSRLVWTVSAKKAYEFLCAIEPFTKNKYRQKQMQIIHDYRVMIEGPTSSTELRRKNQEEYFEKLVELRKNYK